MRLLSINSIANLGVPPAMRGESKPRKRSDIIIVCKTIAPAITWCFIVCLVTCVYLVAVDSYHYGSRLHAHDQQQHQHHQQQHHNNVEGQHASVELMSWVFQPCAVGLAKLRHRSGDDSAKAASTNADTFNGDIAASPRAPLSPSSFSSSLSPSQHSSPPSLSLSYVFHTLDSFLSARGLVATPLRLLLYNMDPAALALHGIHPRWLHLLVNIPMLFAPLLVLWLALACARKEEQDMRDARDMRDAVNNAQPRVSPRVSQCDGVRSEQREEQQTYKSTLDLLFWTGLILLIVPLLLLSTSPHQEPRFLLPLLFPLVLIIVSYSPHHYLLTAFTAFIPDDAHYPHHRQRRHRRHHAAAILIFFLLFNSILVILFGYLHQGGVVSSLLSVSSTSATLHRSLFAEALTSSSSQRGAVVYLNVVYVATYPPPLSLLGLHTHGVKEADRVISGGKESSLDAAVTGICADAGAGGGRIDTRFPVKCGESGARRATGGEEKLRNVFCFHDCSGKSPETVAAGILHKRTLAKQHRRQQQHVREQQQQQQQQQENQSRSDIGDHHTNWLIVTPSTLVDRLVPLLPCRSMRLMQSNHSTGEVVVDQVTPSNIPSNIPPDTATITSSDSINTNSSLTHRRSCTCAAVLSPHPHVSLDDAPRSLEQLLHASLVHIHMACKD